LPTTRVSIIVVNYNGQAWLERCLGAAIAQLQSDDELVLVDNGSNDGSVAWVERTFPQVRIVALPHNVGFAAGNNAGVRACDGEYVALLNNDAAPCPGWLNALRRMLDTTPDVALATSLIVYMHSIDTVDSAGDGLTRWGGGFKHDHGKRVSPEYASRDVFGACGAACMIRRSVFEAIGGFDETFFAVYEDVDLSYRVQLAGHRVVFVPEAVVHHAGSATLGQLSDIAIFHGQRNLEWMYWKNTPWPLLVLTAPGHVVYVLAAALYFAVRGRFRVFITAKWEALRAWRRVWRQRGVVQRSRRSGAWRLWRLMERHSVALKVREKRFDHGLSGNR
jgi:GT2 family glycosyltransferase